MKETYRTAAIQALPAVCNDPRNISYVLRSHLCQEFPGHCVNSTAATAAELPHHLLPADGCSAGNSYTAQAARRAIWMGAFWKKGKKKKRKKERKTELERNATIRVGT